MENFLENIVNADPEHIDALIDDLNDLLQRTVLGQTEAKSLVLGLSKLVDLESSSVALESFFNVLSTLHLQGLAHEEIEGIALEKIHRLPVSSLAHALEIVGASDIHSRGELLSLYAEHSNSYISGLARGLIKST